MATPFRSLGLSALVLALAATGLRADEGMWTFDNLPVKQMQAKYGFAPDRAWLDHVRLSAVRFPGGSGSFISADGLVLTNHHVGHHWTQSVSDAQHDYVKDGFVALNPAQEIKVPGLALYTLLEMENVTESIEKAAKPSMNEAEAAQAKAKALEALVKAQSAKTGLDCQPVSLYQGGQTWIYRYKKHTDVRLVMSPEYGVAAFGKDWDNFSWPRHDLDFSLFRVYENGQPYHPAHHLVWSREGVAYGGMTFTVGHPGRTSRLETLAQMEAKRDATDPLLIRSLDRTRRALHAFAAKGEDQARQVSSEIMGTENAYKVYSSELIGLRDTEAMAKVAAAEKELRAKVAVDPKLKALAGDSWTKIEQAVAEQKALAQDNIAGGLMRQLEALAKEQGALAPSKACMLRASIQSLREELGAGHPLVKALAQGKDEAQILELFRKGLPPEVTKALQASQERQKALQAVISEHLARIAKARFAVYGTSTYPDATFTLRLSYGAVETYPSAGTLAQPFTTFAGMYDRAAAWGPKAEDGSWEVPVRWQQRRDKLDLFTPYDFITTNDIIGGNSGSPVVDRKGELVGLAFDGNIESNAGRYYYDGRVNRCLCVDGRAILEALGKVYDAQNLVNEIRGQ